MLDMILRGATLLRGELRLDNIFPRRPPRNNILYFFRDSKMEYLTDEGMMYVEETRKLIEAHRPNLLVALGGVPMRILTGKKRITKWRGSLLDCILVPGIKVYCTYHPSYVMRHMQEKGQKRDEKKAQNLLPIVIRDLQRASEQSEFPEHRVPQRNITTQPTLGEIGQYFADLPPKSLIGVDIETRPGPDGPIITRVGFAHSPQVGISIPIIWNNAPVWTRREFGELLKRLSQFFLSDHTKIFQGGLYDLSILAKYWGLRCKEDTVEDTMVAHHAAYPHLPKGLDFQASVYTWEPYYKDDGKVWGSRVGDNALSIYHGKDLCVTREIWPILLQDNRQLGTFEGYKRSMSYYPSLLAMTLRGVKCDLEKKAKLGRVFKNSAREHLDAITDLVGREYKISTAYTKDLVQLLYVDLGLAPQYKNGKLTTEDAALLRLKKLYPKNEVLEHIRRRRMFLKFSNTYMNMEVGKDGRFHTSYNPAGTATWRLSSSESPFGGGGNLQNIPSRTEEGRKIRELFIADEGKVLIAADYSQAEARVVAYLAGEQVEIEAFEAGRDIHWLNAIDLGLADADTIPAKEIRDPAKNMKHGYNYEVGPRRLQAELLRYGYDFSYAVCRDSLERIRRKRPMIEGWKRQVRNKVDTDRTLVTPIGRKRVFYGRKGPDLYRKAIAFIPQNTVGELLCIAIRDVHSELEVKQRMVEVLLNGHDELVCQVRAGREREAISALKRIMEIPLEINERMVVIPVDFKIGSNWGQMEEVK
jgi:uracil-DNA glycosylase family 4